MRRDPRVGLSVVDLVNPYRMASPQGVVIEVRPDEGLQVHDPISTRYTNKPFPNRTQRTHVIREPVRRLARVGFRWSSIGSLASESRPADPRRTDCRKSIRGRGGGSTVARSRTLIRVAASASALALVTGAIELLKGHVPVLSLAVLYLPAIIGR